MTEATRSRRGPAPTTGKGKTVGVRMQRAVLAALDQVRAKQAKPMTRAAAARGIIKMWLQQKGLL